MSLKPYYMENILEAGIDEAGRGPLFGRVYVAAVILPQDRSFEHSLMRDSKKISERKRLIAYDYIRENAIDYAVSFIDEQHIDSINIFRATQQGMHDALNKLNVAPQHLLVDGGVGRSIEILRWLLTKGKEEGEFVRLDASVVHIGIAAQAGIPPQEVQKIIDRLQKADCLRLDGSDLLVANEGKR